jgi:DNA recombination protein RmuC
MGPPLLTEPTILFAVGALVLGVILGRYVWPTKPAIDINDFTRAKSECALLNARLDDLNGRYKELNSQYNSQGDLVRAAGEEVARLTEREKTLTEKLTEQNGQLEQLQKRLTTEFENIANRILKASATELSTSSEKTLSSLLEPLRERLNDFQQKVDNTYDAERREVLSLKEQIKLIADSSHDIGSKADGLVKALRGDSQRLGSWGEFVLERILEAAGLQEGREYITQGRGLKLKDESGNIQKPDIVVNLTEGRTVIVDSKTPLKSYELSIVTPDETEQARYRDQLVDNMKGHINDLSGKRYQENDRLQAHDCVLMFVLIEGALAAALTSEPELFTYAWDRGVVLVGPTTLLMTMRTVAGIWQYQRQSQNAEEIAKLAGDLCDKVTMSLTDFNNVTEKLSAAVTAHSEAVKRLSTGRYNALNIGERIRQLGVKTKRPVPAVTIDDLSIARAASSIEITAEDELPTPSPMS